MWASRTFSTTVVAGILIVGLAFPAHAVEPSPGVGGAGAFIPPAHVNGPFGAGGPLAGIGGAGAFIPPVNVNAPFGAGGPLAGMGGAGAFIPPANVGG